jgi:DNA polymerase-3 subunit gamma/tau
MRGGIISGALLLYREVIAKGFGGQHFLTGLCEHLRNLMVSLDPQTLKLIEGSDNLRIRYGQQAQQCGLPMLLGWLGTASDYEFRFREANNKNLFVEICLMKLCSATVATPSVTKATVASPSVTKATVASPSVTKATVASPSVNTATLPQT